MSVVRRLSAIALSLGLVAAQVATCAGWAATPQARMACCAMGVSCPMHKADSHESGSARILTQQQADSCCASSEREQSGPAGGTSALTITNAVLGPAILIPASVPTLVLSNEWRMVTPVPSPPIPKHLLLSVFLV